MIFSVFVQCIPPTQGKGICQYAMFHPPYPTTPYHTHTSTTGRNASYKCAASTKEDLICPIPPGVLNWYATVNSCTTNLSHVCSWILARVSTYFCLT